MQFYFWTWAVLFVSVVTASLFGFNVAEDVSAFKENPWLFGLVFFLVAIVLPAAIGFAYKASLPGANRKKRGPLALINVFVNEVIPAGKHAAKSSLKRFQRSRWPSLDRVDFDRCIIQFKVRVNATKVDPSHTHINKAIGLSWAPHHWLGSVRIGFNFVSNDGMAEEVLLYLYTRWFSLSDLLKFRNPFKMDATHIGSVPVNEYAEVYIHKVDSHLLTDSPTNTVVRVDYLGGDEDTDPKYVGLPLPEHSGWIWSILFPYYGGKPKALESVQVESRMTIVPARDLGMSEIKEVRNFIGQVDQVLDAK